MSTLLFIIIPIIVLVFFITTLCWSYYKYKTLKPPSGSLFPNNKEMEYINNKSSYWEDIGISVGFIVVLLLAAILTVLFRVMYKLG